MSFLFCKSHCKLQTCWFQYLEKTKTFEWWEKRLSECLESGFLHVSPSEFCPIVEINWHKNFIIGRKVAFPSKKVLLKVIICQNDFKSYYKTILGENTIWEGYNYKETNFNFAYNALWH